MSKATKKDQRKIVRMAEYPKDAENQRVQHEFKLEALDTTLIGVVKHWIPH